MITGTSIRRIRPCATVHSGATVPDMAKRCGGSRTAGPELSHKSVASLGRAKEGLITSPRKERTYDSHQRWSLRSNSASRGRRIRLPPPSSSLLPRRRSDSRRDPRPRSGTPCSDACQPSPTCLACPFRGQRASSVPWRVRWRRQSSSGAARPADAAVASLAWLLLSSAWQW